MAIYYYPNSATHTVDIQVVPFEPDFVVLEYNGELYLNAIPVDLSSSSGTRRVFTTFNSATNMLSLSCVTLTGASDEPALTLTDLKIHLITSL